MISLTTFWTLVITYRLTFYTFIHFRLYANLLVTNFSFIFILFFMESCLLLYFCCIVFNTLYLFRHSWLSLQITSFMDVIFYFLKFIYWIEVCPLIFFFFDSSFNHLISIIISNHVFNYFIFLLSFFSYFGSLRRSFFIYFTRRKSVGNWLNF